MAVRTAEKLLKETKPKPGDVRARLLENMVLIATKNKNNIEKALSAFMDIASNEVSGQQTWINRGTMVLASRASGCLFGHPNPRKPSLRTPPKIRGISSNVNLKHIIEFLHLHIIPMTLYKDIMPYFDTFIHVYGWNLSILWSPLIIWMPKNYTIANFGHPVSKSWLRPWEEHMMIFFYQSKS